MCHHPIQPALFNVWVLILLTHWILFPMVRHTQKHQCVNHYISELHERLWEVFKEAMMQYTSEAERQKWHYNRKANPVSLEPGDLVLAKANAYRGEEKGERSVGERTIWSGVPSCRRHPFLPHEKSVDWMFRSPPLNQLFSHYSNTGDSSLYSCAGQVVQVHHHCPRETNWGSTKKCELSIASPAPDRWDSSRLGK